LLFSVISTGEISAALAEYTNSKMHANALPLLIMGIIMMLMLLCSTACPPTYATLLPLPLFTDSITQIDAP